MPFLICDKRKDIDFDDEFNTENDELSNDYSDYFDCHNEDLDPDQQDIEFWNQF